MLILPFLYVASLYHKDACYKESLRKRPKWLPCKTPSKCQPGKASKLNYDLTALSAPRSWFTKVLVRRSTNCGSLKIFLSRRLRLLSEMRLHAKWLNRPKLPSVRPNFSFNLSYAFSRRRVRAEILLWCAKGYSSDFANRRGGAALYRRILFFKALKQFDRALGRIACCYGATDTHPVGP